MAIKAAMQKAAVRLLGRSPDTFFGASGKFELELCDLVNEVAEDVAAYQDWQSLIRLSVLAGGAGSYSLPADYSRMMKNSDVQDPQNWVWGYYRFTDINDFLYEEARGFSSLPGGWIIFGDEMRFSPTPSGQAQFPYISSQWAKGAGGAPKSAFTLDTDSFILPERLLTLGLVWRWNEQKRLDASGDQEAFVKALDEYASKDGGSRVLRFGNSSSRIGRFNVGLAWPGGWS